MDPYGENNLISPLHKKKASEDSAGQEKQKADSGTEEKPGACQKSRIREGVKNPLKSQKTEWRL